jgi:two-component system cell cycle sensor histidine kinase/response regulator CckA
MFSGTSAHARVVHRLDFLDGMNTELAPIGMVETTLDGRFLAANHAFVEMLAYPSREALLEQPATAVYRSAEDRRTIVDALRRHGVVEEEELQLMRADGRAVWTRISAHLVEGRIHGYILPIDEWKETRERYAEIVDTIGAVSWRADRTTLRFTEVSDEAERLLGFPLERWFAEGFWESRIHPDDREWAVAFCKSATAANRSHQFEYRMLAEDGRVIRVRDMVRVHDDAEISGVLLDITVERVAEERIRASEERYRSVVDGARDIIYTVTPDAMLTSANPAFETITGWKAADWIGRNVLLLLHPDDRARVEQQLAEHGDELREFEVRMRMADGTYRMFEVWRAARFTADGRVAERFGFARDVSQQRMLESEIQQFEQTMRVVALDRIAATMAHEFRNVLMAVAAARDILRRSASGDVVKSATSILTSCMRRGQAITDDALRFTRPGRLDGGPISANTLLHDVAIEAEALLRGADLQVLEPTEPVTIDGDARLLQQALLNLILNAREVSPKGGTIQLAAQRAEDARSLHIWVRDEGPGIPPDVLPRIFEPLFTTKHNGTGLGLAVTKQIVAMHKGTISAKSVPGAGAEFHIVLPL